MSMTTSQHAPSDVSDAARPAWECRRATRFDLIGASLGRIYSLKGNKYHTGEQYVAALNERWPYGWGFECVSWGADNAELWVHGKLSVTFHECFEDRDCAEWSVVKEDFGAHPIALSNQTGDPVSLGDNRKAAATDALKRCARQLGLGLYLWEKEDLALRYAAEHAAGPTADASHSAGDTAARATRQTAPADRTPTTTRPAATTSAPSGLGRDVLEPRYLELLERVTRAGMPHTGWMDVPVEKMTPVQLERYGALMDSFLERSQVGAA
jgi:hypothetical protein